MRLPADGDMSEGTLIYCAAGSAGAISLSWVRVFVFGHYEGTIIQEFTFVSDAIFCVFSHCAVSGTAYYLFQQQRTKVVKKITLGAVAFSQGIMLPTLWRMVDAENWLIWWLSYFASLIVSAYFSIAISSDFIDNTKN